MIGFEDSGSGREEVHEAGIGVRAMVGDMLGEEGGRGEGLRWWYWREGGERRLGERVLWGSRVGRGVRESGSGGMGGNVWLGRS